MFQTIYRKYRPQTFAEVVDQNHIKITLQNEILSGQIAHAYLFTGPRGIGKTSLARILAKSLNCEKRKEKEFEPCNQCHSCQEILAGKDLDLIEIDAATHTQVDKVRENIVENIKFPPHNKYKIFIIDEVHMLSTAAFNALLKTLEEPPEYVVFVLCTTEIYKIPETIVSRCQRFDFKKVGVDLVAKKLKKIVQQEKIKMTDEVLQTIALRSAGFVRDAESMLGQIVALLAGGKKEITLDEVQAVLPRSDLKLINELIATLIKNDAAEAVSIINKLLDEGVDLERFNLDLIDYLRKLMLVKVNLKDRDSNISALPQEAKQILFEQAEEMELSELTQMMEKFITIQYSLKDAEIPQLPLEIAAVEICQAATENPSHPEISSRRDKINKQQTINDLRQMSGLAERQPQSELKQINDKQFKSTKKEVLTKREVIKKNEAKSDTSINITLQQIKKCWPKILRLSQEHNHSLPVILKSGYPHWLEDNTLIIGFEYEIHARRLQDEKCLLPIEEILKDVCGKILKIKAEILTKEKFNELKEEYQTALPEIDDDQLNEIASSFGGKVVE